jgi:hypothetical protein
MFAGNVSDEKKGNYYQTLQAKLRERLGERLSDCLSERLGDRLIEKRLSERPSDCLSERLGDCLSSDGPASGQQASWRSLIFVVIIIFILINDYLKQQTDHNLQEEDH